MQQTVATRPSHAELIARAEGMVPILKARADAYDAAGQIPPETVAMFEAAGFYKIRFGGDPSAVNL